MSFNKKILAAAVVSGLFVTTAQAQVTISNATPVPVRIASEVNFTAGKLTVTNAAGALNIISASGYAFSNGETRHVRFECSSNMEFTTATAASSLAGSLGAVNGVGTNAIHFSYTAGAVGTSDFTIDGNRAFTSRDAVTCTYGLYDQPSQAAQGGATGRIATSTGSYANFMTSYLYRNTVNTSTANVEANPSFTSFVVTGNPTGLATIAQIGRIEFNTRAALTTGAQPRKADGTLATLADILDATTSHVVSGDFSAAASAGATPFDAAARARVRLHANADCTGGFTNATALTATTATFVTGALAIDGYLCYAPRSPQAIQASQYTISLMPVSNAGYTAGPLGPEFVGTILRNGTELQAPLAQVPAGYLSRMVLTNKGTLPRTYSVEVLTESGNTRSGGDASMLTGSVPANSMVVVDLNPLMGSFTGAPRGALNVTVAAPSTQIQGLYQIVNPANGSISNHVMVRPGTN